MVMAVSLPMTWAATWQTTSGMTGLTLPGMIDEPFWSSGRVISPSPQRGPLPIHAMSVAILVSETATTFSAPDSSTRASRRALGLEGVGGRCDGAAQFGGQTLSHPAAKSGWVLSPVPTALPPSGICPTRPSVAVDPVDARGGPGRRSRRTPGRG